MKLFKFTIPLAFLATGSCLYGQNLLESLEPLTVVGSAEDVFTLTGSGTVVTAEEFRKQGYTNINRIFGRIPGVYTREEDGYGNFPNISIRGGDGTRAEKVTIMEDGILSAPAPYSGPSAYYSPRAGRMSAIEILKGSSQIQYGPQTTGGVINYISTQIPVEETFFTRMTYGSDNEVMLHTYYGNSVETKDQGRVGYLFELYGQRADGFREIEGGAGFAGSDNTGFSVFEPMFKAFWEPNTRLKQRFEFKYGYTDFEADESYAGLSEGIGGTPDDVSNNPDRRYAATRFDNIQTKQHRTYLKHSFELNEDLRFETAVYYNQFERNWFKLDGLLDAGGNSLNVRDALATTGGLAILRGRAAGSLVLRNNAREYASYGIQNQGSYAFETGAVDHTLSFGVRYHEDYMDRDQFDEIADQDVTGAVTGSRFRLNNVRREESQALSLWIKDEVKFDKWTVTPGVRYETVRVTQADFNEDKSIVANQTALAALRAAATSTNTQGNYDEVIPGVSFNYELNEELIFFGGVHKGISVPGPRSAIAGSDVEESIGYEFGTRYRDSGIQAEFVGFFTDFKNILGTTAGTGAGAITANGGAAEVYGVEMLVAYDALEGSDASLPIYASATWTSAEFKSNNVGGGADSIYNGAGEGSNIPYIPEWKLAAGIGYQTAKWGVNLDATFASETFGTGANLDQTAGTNTRQGQIDSLVLFDLSGRYTINDNINLIGGIANLLDERGVVSRIPRGPRNNQGRTAFVGFESTF